MSILTDESLVIASRQGDRAAFADLVQRYRNLVVRVAYSGLGDFAQSEDIAQQTFVTAWERKFDLKEPGRIAAWLCGIARNLVRNQRRRFSRESAVAISNDAVATAAKTPEEQSIDREELQILWSVLERIPATYREPMILFYREEATTAEVAAALDISEDVVRQRLSRGRRMLEEKVAEFVETTLSKRGTSKEFVASVLLALPAGSVPKVATGILATFAGKSLVGILGAVGGSLIGIAGGVYGSKRSLDQASSDVERRYLWRMILQCTLLVCALLVVQTYLILWQPEFYRRPVTQILLWGSYTVALLTLILRGNRRLRRIKIEHGTDSERELMESGEAAPVSPRTAKWNLVGAIVGSTAWMLVAAIAQRDWLGLLLAVSVPGTVLAIYIRRIVAATTGQQQMQINWQAVGATVVGTIIVVALRWNAWYDAFAH